LVIARAIKSEYAGRDTGILDIAQAVGRTPGSSALRSLITSSGKYGLTEGSYASPQISLTARGLAVVAPRDELESPKALIEAALEPAPFKEFYTKYDQNRLPQDAIALNVLERECGIPAAVSGECLELIKVNA
jgi:hypothetical protein